MSDSSDGKWTRRRFLEAIGMAGGAAAVYETMTALGLINVPEVFARQPLPPNSGTGKSVVILGAGIAGLTAAYELKNAHYDVTVLEAQNRIGGRNHTVRRGNVLEEITGTRQVCRFDDGLYLNAGPGRLPYHHTAILEYCRILDVPLEVYVMMTRANLFQNSKGYADRPAFDGKPMVNRRIANDTRGYISELLAKAINKGALDDRLNAHDKEALLDLLTVFGDVEKSKGYVYEGSSRSGYDIQPGILPCPEVVQKLTLQSLLDANFWKFRFYQSEEYEWQPTLFEPIGGMDGIVKGFERHVGGLVRTERVVTRVHTYDDHVEVEHRGPGGATELQKADWCISTIPLPILNKISNNFRDDYKTAIENVKFADTCKVGWQANRRFWERDEEIYGGISYIHHNITQMWYPSHGYLGDKGVLTGAYNYDDNAREMGDMELPDRLDLAMKGAQRLHPRFAEFVPKDLGLSIAWQKVPHQLGGWADDIDCNSSTYRRLLLPERRFWVSGDQVSQISGWQEGAIRSALYVLERIHNPALLEEGTRAPRLKAAPRRAAPSTRRRTRGLP
jgi:monoamine oxidase